MKLKNRVLWTGVVALGLVMVAPSAQAHEVKKGDLTIIHPAARPNMPNRPTAAYMAISNEGSKADRLIAATSEAFGTIELHATMQHGDVMKMMPVDGVDVPAEDTALLEPGGLHLMLFDGNERFKIGDSFMMTLTFEQAGDVMVEVKVEQISGGLDHSKHGSAESGHSGHKKPATQ
ncbi:MAG: copper chaperone PCu(A)C [Paracoccaceae bacterium]